MMMRRLCPAHHKEAYANINHLLSYKDLSLNLSVRRVLPKPFLRWNLGIFMPTNSSTYCRSTVSWLPGRLIEITYNTITDAVGKVATEELNILVEQLKQTFGPSSKVKAKKAKTNLANRKEFIAQRVSYVQNVQKVRSLRQT